jgi:broad specificity phosphatase PhoE
MTELRSKIDKSTGKPPRLVLVRHAHRDTSQGRLRDNGLSAKGWRQADKFAAWAVESLPLDRTALASSPKLRCLETLEPLSRPIRRWESLGEQRFRESDAAFRKRVASALQAALRNNAKAVVLCSHGDWLPVAAEVLTGRPLDWKKGAWKEFRVKSRALLEGAELLDPDR